MDVSRKRQNKQICAGLPTRALCHKSLAEEDVDAPHNDAGYGAPASGAPK